MYATKRPVPALFCAHKSKQHEPNALVIQFNDPPGLFEFEEVLVAKLRLLSLLYVVRKGSQFGTPLLIQGLWAVEAMPLLARLQVCHRSLLSSPPRRHNPTSMVRTALTHSPDTISSLHPLPATISRHRSAVV